MYVSPNAAALAAESPAGAYETFRTPLLAYVHNLLEPLDWERSESFARMAFAQALGSLDLTEDAGMEDEGLPAWLASAARTVVRQQTSAATAAERFVTVRKSKPAPIDNHGLVLLDTPAPTEVSASQANVSPVPLAA